MKQVSSSSLSFSRFIIQAIKPFPWQIVGLIFVACYWALHLSLQPYVIKLILDQLKMNSSPFSMLTSVAFYILLSFAFTFNFRLHDYICLKFYPALKANILAEATKKISHYSYTFFQNQLSGKLTDKIKSLSKGSIEVVQIILDRIFSHTLALLVAFFTLMTVNPLLAWVFLSWAFLLILLSLLATKKARLLSHQLSGANSHAIGMMVDRFTNILNVRLFAAYQYEEDLLNNHLKKMVQQDKNLRKYLLKLMALQGILTAIMISVCLLVLMFAVDARHLTIGDFALVLNLTLSFSDIIWHFAQEVSHFSEIYGMVTQGLALLNQPLEIKDSSNAKKLIVIRGEISFQKVNFHYPHTEPLFSNKSITIDAGQKVGLVGYSGSGKSTFVNLILRLFEVKSGNIFIDQQDIKQITQESLHHNIGLIPQEPTLFNRTLLENIRYGDLQASLEEVIKAAKKAHAHEFIEALPEGYHTLVGERGIKLSGGQRQRIAIARVILKDAPILLLDEATSALDSVTENLIKDTFMEIMQNKTTIVIAHRLSTLLHMDRILVFDKGKIVEDGKHTELLEKKGHYEKIWNAQVGGFILD